MINKQKVIKYSGQVIVSFIAPFLLLIGIISLRPEGEYGVIAGTAVSVLFLNIFYSFYNIKSLYLIKFGLGLLVTVISIGTVYLILHYQIKPSFDRLGVYSAYFGYSFSAFFCWELFYKFLRARGNNEKYKTANQNGS